jgi:DNA-binding transcriptional LysR family regulator
MDFDQLKGFYYAAKLKSFTEAASKLYLTQPAVSLQVKALENEIGTKLFERVGRTVRLTYAGEVMFVQAEHLVCVFDNIEQEARALKALEKGRLLLGASDTTSAYSLPDLLKAFKSSYPKVEVKIESMYSSGVARKLLDRELDLGFVTVSQGEPREKEQRFSAVPLFAQKLVCIVPSGHPFSRLRSVAASDLAGEPLILLGSESLTRKRIDGYFERAGRSPSVTYELSNFEIIKRFVAAGLGVSLVPEIAVAQPVPGLQVVALKRRLTVEVGILHHRDRVLSRPAAAFLEMARRHFAVPPAAGGEAPPARPSPGNN